MNLEGPRDNSFVELSSVDISNLTLSFSQNLCWLPVRSLGVNMVIRDWKRDEDNDTFLAWPQTIMHIMHVAWSCANARIKMAFRVQRWGLGE